jgi:capsule biosynthesis phosphatase
MRIVIDLDGVICSIKKEGQDYFDVEPLPGAIDYLKNLKKEGHYIIISTARHMLSAESNLGLVKKKIGKKTFDWLEKYDIPYDEIYFGKPYGQIYIDDNAVEFYGWDKYSSDHFNLNKINIVIPMAGRGQRFVDAGYKEPKPLIKINGKYMFELAVESFNTLLNKKEVQLIFIILKEHSESFDLKKCFT